MQCIDLFTFLYSATKSRSFISTSNVCITTSTSTFIHPSSLRLLSTCMMNIDFDWVSVSDHFPHCVFHHIGHETQMTNPNRKSWKAPNGSPNHHYRHQCWCLGKQISLLTSNHHYRHHIDLLIGKLWWGDSVGVCRHFCKAPLSGHFTNTIFIFIIIFI